MRSEGPQLESLTHRLAECPQVFLDEPKIGNSGTIVTAAVVADTLRRVAGSDVAPDVGDAFALLRAEDRNWLRTVQVACWLLHDPWFEKRAALAPGALILLRNGLREFARVVPAELLVHDADRREELARRSLALLLLRPAGETLEQARDRLTAIDSIERERVMLEARNSMEHARKVREAMEKKAKEDAAAKPSRE